METIFFELNAEAVRVASLPNYFSLIYLKCANNSYASVTGCFESLRISPEWRYINFINSKFMPKNTQLIFLYSIQKLAKISAACVYKE